MSELLFKEYERLYNNYNICLAGFRTICAYCKDKALPSNDIMVIGKIIEKCLDELKDAPAEVKNND